MLTPLHQNYFLLFELAPEKRISGEGMVRAAVGSVKVDYHGKVVARD
jgi:hypothetical protein